MSAASISENSRVQGILNRCRRQILLHTLLNGAALILIGLLSALLIATTLDFLIGLPGIVRALFLTVCVGLTVWIAWRTLISRMLHRIPQKELGAAVDLSVPDLNESLTTLISLQQPGVSDGEAGSELMRDHLEERVVDQLRHLDPRGFVDSGRLLRRIGLASVVIFAVLLPVALWPEGSQVLLARLIDPLSDHESATDLYFNVENGNRIVAIGSDVQIQATPAWRSGTARERPESVELVLQSSTGDIEVLPMQFDETFSAFVGVIPEIPESLSFRVRGDGAVTRSFQLTAVEAPALQSAVMTATPPVYTGRAIEQFDGMIGTMQVFEQSRLEVSLEFNKPVTSAELVWLRRDQRPLTETEKFDIEFDHMTGEIIEEDPEMMNPDTEPAAPEIILVERISAELSADRRSASLTLTADVGGDFVFEIRDEHELPNPAEPERTLRVIFDQPPELVVSGIHDADEFRPDDLVPVNCHVVDDLGIGSLELHYRINGQVTKILPATGFDRGARVVQEAFRLKLADLGVVDGDFVMLRVRTADERPIPGPQEVWSEELAVRIDNNAKAAGAQAMDARTKELLNALKLLEKQLEKDIETAQSLERQTRTEWTEQQKNETQGLSEKEQQQAQILDSLAREVATHPLMKEPADNLSDLSNTLRQDIPERLDQATHLDRRAANRELEDTQVALEEAKERLSTEIENIETLAKLEQNLAELNRLALDANQLAEDARQLQEDRSNAAQKPEEMSEQQWKDNLERRQNQIAAKRDALSSDLDQLLQDEHELLNSAQQSQQEQLQELADRVQELAQRQDRLTEGVNDEAEQTARSSGDIAADLQKARDDAAALDQKLPDSSRSGADLQELDKAVSDLNQGNLQTPEQAARNAAETLQNQEQQLKAEPNADPKTESVAKESGDLAERFREIEEQIRDMRQERIAAAPSDEELPKGDPNRQPASDLLQRARDLADAAEALADKVESDAAVEESAAAKAREAADNARQGSNTAESGKFSEAASDVRKASRAARESSAGLNSDQNGDDQQQLDGLQDDLSRLARSLDNLQQDSTQRSSAQQQTQNDIAQQTEGLPQQLGELAERLGLPQLQMPQQAQQAGQAQQSAGQAQQNTQQAAQDLENGQLQNAAANGQQASRNLNELADLAQSAGQRPDSSDSPIPSEVGNSVASALQDLQQAAQAMQEGGEQQPGPQDGQPSSQSGQPGSQSGEGQPGQNGEPQQGGTAGTAERRTAG